MVSSVRVPESGMCVYKIFPQGHRNMSLQSFSSKWKLCNWSILARELVHIQVFWSSYILVYLLKIVFPLELCGKVLFNSRNIDNASWI